jgi:hypothetical protein
MVFEVRPRKNGGGLEPVVALILFNERFSSELIALEERSADS